ncbi:MAG TPA: heme-dependent oxidative N-demethylase subunit alpha family protein, partial [Burkholderiaceae bacterium]
MPFDFNAAVVAPFRMQPGLRRVAPGAPQLTPARDGSRALREKLAALRHHAEQALLADPVFDPLPALHALAAHAAREYPGVFGIEGDSTWHAQALGWSLHGTTPRNAGGAAAIGDCLHALPTHRRLAALFALAFEQDFAILDARSGRVPWLAVCLPSHWAPEDKIGRRFAEIHAPVADNATLLAASDALVRLVTGDERWERFVWTVT